MGLLSIFRVIFGLVFTLFLPGYLLIKILYRTEVIPKIEKIVLSIAVSVALIMLIFFITNFVFRISLSELNSLVILSIFVLSEFITLLVIKQ